MKLSSKATNAIKAIKSLDGRMSHNSLAESYPDGLIELVKANLVVVSEWTAKAADGHEHTIHGWKLA